jgi:exonuclease 3'-5' domain-containing protein 1
MSARKSETLNTDPKAATKRAPVATVSEISSVENALEKMGLDDRKKSIKFIEMEDDLRRVIETIENAPTNPPSLYLDLEGVNLSRHGNISILQIFISPLDEIYLVDIHTLKRKAFTASSLSSGETLLSILESPDIPKVFFDVRNDSDAFFSHFGVRLAGIIDLQLMELATRSSSKRCVNGLAKCIERDAPITETQRKIWKESKEKGRELFAPELGGSFEVFNARPLPDSILAYCAQDVHILPRLWHHYERQLSPTWKKRVAQETIERVKQSQSADYVGKGRHMALGPSGWY